MNMLDLLQHDGFTMRRKASTGGGEYAGACPWCGGRDRFLVWPNKRELGLYWCRGCGKSGDAIQYLRDFRGFTYKSACGLLGISHDMAQRPKVKRRRPRRPTWKPKKSSTPGREWQQRALKIIEKGISLLWATRGTQARMWLQRRGYHERTIQEARLGIGHNGLLIPCFSDDKPVRVRIRKWDPGDGPRYILLKGSDTRPMITNPGKPGIVIVESELDAWIVHQEAGDLITVVALGSAQAKPDRDTHRLLKNAETVLVALDSDEAGAKATWSFWINQYQSARRWPVPMGKDPGDAFQSGLNIRMWINAGLDRSQTTRGNVGPAFENTGQNIVSGKLGEQEIGS